MLRKLFLFTLFTGIICALVGVGVAVWGYNYYSRDLPSFEGESYYRIDGASAIYSVDGVLLAEDYDERRYPIKISQVPKHVIQAFLAAEDVDFYKHPGIDLYSIMRAMYVNFQEGFAKQGGSTITQQVVKNLLLTREKKLERKIKEAILAFRIEKHLSKNEILELYLNQIFFGNTAYGIQAASKVYFHKDVSELEVAEAAMLAGLPKAPSRFSPIKNLKLAKQRQRYVLTQMHKANFISKVEADTAYEQELEIFKANRRKLFEAPYYVTEIRRIMRDRWKDLDLERDNLKIYASVDLKAQELARNALRNGLEAVDQRRGWRGPIDRLGDIAVSKVFNKMYQKKIKQDLQKDKIYPAVVTKVTAQMVDLDLGHYQTRLNLAEYKWASRYLDEKDKSRWVAPHRLLKVGDVIEVKLKDSTKQTFELAQTPEVQGAVVLLNPHSGQVLSAVGGYDYYKSQFNRVTQSLRQPGSAFKPIVYLAAIDAFGYTASTIVFDEPRAFRVGDDIWTPGNFDSKYMGPIPLRVALEKSRNLVSADIIARIGIDPVLRYARKMGIRSPLGSNLSISLGSSEVTPLEITRAYGVFPAKGYFYESVFIDRIEDADGKVIYKYQDDLAKNSRQVISEKSAFIMAHLMEGVVKSGTGWRVRDLKRPAAGKTGTSNDQMDAWYIGYTPDLVAGVWVGFDLKKEIGEKETGGRAAVPIWLDFIKNYLEHKDENREEDLATALKQESEYLGIQYKKPEPPAPAKFSPPDGLQSYWIEKATGHLSSPNEPGAILEYYLPGSQPQRASETTSDNYWELEE